VDSLCHITYSLSVAYATDPALMESTPADFWAELKRQKLIEQNAPTPS
jgi:hypothetical protein